MQVGEPLAGFEGILGGAPDYHGGTELIDAECHEASEPGAARRGRRGMTDAATAASSDGRVLVHAPRGRDAEVVDRRCCARRA